MLTDTPTLRKAARIPLSPEERAERAKTAAARQKAERQARRKVARPKTSDLSPMLAMSLYGVAPREGLPKAPPPPVLDSPEDVKHRLRCLYRELNTIQAAIDELHDRPTTH
jgi:hypothetical protein